MKPSDREPEAVELLATEDERRLETALSASRPISTDPLDELIAEIRQAELERKAAQ